MIIVEQAYMGVGVAEFEFGLLGPLMVRRGGVTVTVPPGKQRVILAMLLFNAGRVVRLDELSEMLWTGPPPPSGPVAVQNYVMRLRKSLGDADRERIITQQGGYLIRAGRDELDVELFEALLAAARSAARDGSWDRAAAHAREALALWRGEPLADVGSEMLTAREVPRLAELRMQAVETRVDADLRLGRHREVIAELRQLAGTHPLRERLHGLLMLALYRDGRQAEALAAYQQARQVLIEDLGTEPGTGLRELHQRILASDPALELPEAGQPVTRDRDPVEPRQLPATVRHFTGRAAEMEALSALLDQAGELAPEVVVISAIGGTAGVGKTALAVQWAHQVAGRFPDGQLYVNLRGYDPAQPVPATDALARFLRALGVAGTDIPPEEDERAARYRSLLAGKRLLVVLDNAGSADQVRPLLPGSPSCTVVVTSRDALAGLVARDGATRLDLDRLPLEEAAGLLRTLIGARVDAAPDAAAELAEQCCRLPLALRVAAELATSHPDVPLAELTSELADLRKRLDLLAAGGDPHTAVRAVFSWSYRQLGPGPARAFRLAALHPGSDFGPHAVAALTGATLGEGREMLGVLTRAHLIQHAGPDRYGMHDLLRAYARELAASQDSAQSRRQALTHLFDHYLFTAATAMDMVFPAESDRRPRVSPPGSPSPALTGIAAARAWLDTERVTLAAVAVHAGTRGWPGHATRLAATLFRYLETGGYYPEIIAIHDHARRAARDAGDRAAEAEAMIGLIVTDLRQGRYQQASDRLRQALEVYRQAGNQAGEARALGNLGIAAMLQGQYQQATSYLHQALALYRQTGDQSGQARQLSNLGLVELRLGRHQLAAQHLDQALDICRQVRDRDTEAYALSNLGIVTSRLGHHQLATQHLDQALDICRQTGNRDCEADALSNLGIVTSRLGHHQLATQHLNQALDICRQTGDRDTEAEILNGLGEALLTAGRPSDALVHHTTALGLARQIDNSYERASAHRGLARAHQAAGALGEACRQWRQALSLYADLGVPEADQVRAQLATTEHRDHREP